MKKSINFYFRAIAFAALTILVAPMTLYGQITPSFANKVAQYDELSDYSFGFAKVKKAGKYGFIDKEGNEIVECVYEDAGTFSDGMAYVKQNGKYGFIDNLGELTIPIQYSKVQDFADGLAWINDDGPWCVIDKYNNKVFTFMKPSKSRSDFEDGLSKITPPGDAPDYYIDNKGEILNLDGHTPDYNYGVFSDQLILCTSEDADGNSKSYYIDRNKNIIINGDPKYSYCPFVNGLAPFISWEDSMMGYINKKGEVAIPPTIPFMAFDDLETGGVFYNKEGMIRTIKFTEEEEIRYGFIDVHGQLVVPYKYKDAQDFVGGLAAVCDENGKWGFINKEGELVIPFLYDGVSFNSFQDGYALVKIGDRYGYVDKKGNDTFVK